MGAPEGRADPEGQADATATPPGGPAHALGHRRGRRVASTTARGRTVSLTHQPGLRRRAVGPAEVGPGAGVGGGARGHPAVSQVHERCRWGAVVKVGSRGQLGERAAGPRKQLLQTPTSTHQLLR